MAAIEANTQHLDHDNHGDKTVTIVVNTREHSWDETEISFEQVFKLAYPDHHGVFPFYGHGFRPRSD